MKQHHIIRMLLLAVCFCYPMLELTRLILVYQYWDDFDLRPIIELAFIWSLFFIGLYSSTKIIKYKDTV